MDKLLLGVNTTVIGMGIVFLVLIALCYIVKLESFLFKQIIKHEESSTNTIDEVYKTACEAPSEDDKKGRASGELAISGIENEEELAAIMAVVSRDTNIPLNKLKFKSIKRI